MENLKLLEYAKLLKNNGFTVYVPIDETSNYFTFEKGGFFGYVQRNIYQHGYDFSIKYQGSQKWGSGYQFKDETELKLENAIECLNWGEKKISQIKVKNFDINRNHHEANWLKSSTTIL